MKGIKKQATGFKFGKYRLQVLKEIGEITHNSRKYKLLELQTHDDLIYWSLRLYNSSGKFIKQLLFEPEIRLELAELIGLSEKRLKHGGEKEE